MTFNERLHPRSPANGEFVERGHMIRGLEKLGAAVDHAVAQRASHAAVPKVTTPKKRRLTPDEQDLADELSANGATVHPDGTVTVYHFTSAANAEKILTSGKMSGAEDGVFFTTRHDAGQGGAGRGGVGVEFRIPLGKLVLDDAFGDEAHVRIPTRRAGESVDVAKWVA